MATWPGGCSGAGSEGKDSVVRRCELEILTGHFFEQNGQATTPILSMRQVYTGEFRPLWPLLFAVVFTLGSALWRVCTWPLLPVDETRYLSVVWEMWLRHDWLVPHLNGSVYVDKPPVLFWLILAGWKVFGVVEWWPRLIPALAAVGALALTARLARVLWPADPRAGAAVWILTTMVWWFLWTGLVMFDLLLTVAVLLGWNALVDPPCGRGRWLWFALAVGAGVLIKGPVVLLFLLPPALLAPWWRGESVSGAWYGRLALATVGGLALVLLWFIPAVWQAGWDYGRGIGFQQTASRVVNSHAHRRPFWWYLPLVPAVTLPWSIWAWSHSRAGTDRPAGLKRGDRFLAAAVGPAFATLCLISGKQVHYLLPLFPALALWLARRSWLAPTASRRGYAAWLALGALPMVAWAGVRWVPVLARLRSWSDGVAVVWLLLPVLVPAWLWMIRNRWRTLPGVVPSAWVAGSTLFSLVAAATPALQSHYELGALARQVHELEKAHLPVAWVGRYEGQLNFLGRLRHPVEEISPGEAQGWAQARDSGWLLEPVKHGKARPAVEGVRWYAVGDGGIALWPARLWLAHHVAAVTGGKGSH